MPRRIRPSSYVCTLPALATLAAGLLDGCSRGAPPPMPPGPVANLPPASEPDAGPQAVQLGAMGDVPAVTTHPVRYVPDVPPTPVHTRGTRPIVAQTRRPR